jgi:hypothetical protein
VRACPVEIRPTTVEQVPLAHPVDALGRMPALFLREDNSGRPRSDSSSLLERAGEPLGPQGRGQARFGDNLATSVHSSVSLSFEALGGPDRGSIPALSGDS